MVRHISVPRRRRRPRYRKPALSVKQILAWADDEHAQTGRWPTCHGGRVIGTDDESWSAIDLCLRLGLRGLPKGSSLTRLLAEERGVRNPRALPRLRIRQVLRWVDAHHHS